MGYSLRCCGRHLSVFRLERQVAYGAGIGGRAKSGLLYTSLDNMAMFRKDFVIFVVIFCVISPDISTGRHLVKRQTEDEKLQSK